MSIRRAAFLMPALAGQPRPRGARMGRAGASAGAWLAHLRGKEGSKPGPGTGSDRAGALLGAVGRDGLAAGLAAGGTGRLDGAGGRWSARCRLNHRDRDGDGPASVGTCGAGGVGARVLGARRLVIADQRSPTPRAAGSWMRKREEGGAQAQDAREHEERPAGCGSAGPAEGHGRGSELARSSPEGGGRGEGEAADGGEGRDVEGALAPARSRPAAGRRRPARARSRSMPASSASRASGHSRASVGEQPQEGDAGDAERAGRQHRARAQPIDERAPQRRRQHADAAVAAPCSATRREAHLQVPQHVEREEAAGHTHGDVPARVVAIRPRTRRSRNGRSACGQADATRGAAAATGSCCRRISRTVTTPQRHASTCRPASVGAHQLVGARASSSTPDGRGGQRAAEHAQAGALAEVAAADAPGHELAHPRDPGVVAQHAEDGGQRRHAEQHRAAGAVVDGQEGQERPAAAAPGARLPTSHRHARR